MLAEIATVLAALKNGFEISKLLVQADHAIDLGQLKLKVGELMGSLAEGQVALLEADKAVQERDAEIARLRAAFEQSLELVEGPNGYKYAKGPDGGPLGRPACPHCLGDRGRISFLLRDGAMMTAKCPSCDRSFTPVTPLGTQDAADAKRQEREAEQAIRNRRQPF